jgi:aarF domain-containing kinase
MTDDSPRLKAALRYMVYGNEGSFDAEKLIDLLQALEKFTAVRDEGDGSAFKVDGVRGSMNLGVAGDFAGTKTRPGDEQQSQQQQPTESAKTKGLISLASRGMNVADADTSRLEALGGYMPPPPRALGINNLREQSDQDQRTVREALRFFFSPEGNVFRAFITEEAVNFVDASGREASEELLKTLGIANNVPMSSFFRAMSPKLSSGDKRSVQQMRKLAQFLVGDLEGAMISSSSGTSTTGNGSSSGQRLRKLLPVMREYSPQLREFGTLLGIRLTEKALSRGLNWASQRIGQISNV